MAACFSWSCEHASSQQAVHVLVHEWRGASTGRVGIFFCDRHIVRLTTHKLPVIRGPVDSPAWLATSAGDTDAVHNT